jgi:hypothetical protein
MSRFHLTAAAVAALAFGAPAMADDVYPRTTGTGENIQVEYGPAGQGNLMGGGRVAVSGSGEELRLRHLDPEYAQAPRQGLVPLTVGSGEGSTTVWVPAGMARSRLALIGSDGSLPGGTGRDFLAAMSGRAPGRG